MKRKVIRTTITLVGDTFEDGSNVLIAEGLRTSVVVRFGGGAIMPQAEVVGYGLNMSAMHRLMRIRWQDMRSMMNTIRVEAGEQGEDLSLVFQGNITFANIDTSNAPEIGLRISCMSGVLEAYRPSPPISFEGGKSVVEAIREISDRMGYSFENNGVPDSLVMENVMLTETDMNKIRRLCRAYQIDLYIEHGSIAIAPQGSPRSLKIPVLTPNSGMIGYPVSTIQGVDVRCLWSPEIKFGGIVRIRDSIMQTTNGDWRAFGVTTHLESELPGGNWFSDIQAAHREPNNVAISRT